MTTLTEPIAASWLRDLSRYIATGATAGEFFPAADVLVTEEDVTVHMDVPGVTRENLEIELENDVLTIRGERPYPYKKEEGGCTWRRVERGFGRFERDVRVPKGLEPDSIEASLEDGVLTLRIRKPEPLRPRRIEIGGATRDEQQRLEGATA
jgi:HSP20 family protein